MREQELQELLLSLLTVETETFGYDFEMEAQGPLLQAVGTFAKKKGVAHEAHHFGAYGNGDYGGDVGG